MSKDSNNSVNLLWSLVGGFSSLIILNYLFLDLYASKFIGITGGILFPVFFLFILLISFFLSALFIYIIFSILGSEERNENWKKILKLILIVMSIINAFILLKFFN